MIALARTAGGLEELDDEIARVGGSASLAVADVADSAALQSIADTITERWGRLDVLVHCAIFASRLGPAMQISGADLESAISVNYRATREIIARFGPLLARDGIAAFIDDPQADRPYFGCYGSSKRAQIGLATCWREETRRIGPRVEIFSPKPMFTRTRRKFMPGSNPDLLSTPETEASRLLVQLGL